MSVCAVSCQEHDEQRELLRFFEPDDLGPIEDIIHPDDLEHQPNFEQPNELDDQEDHGEHDNAVDVVAATATTSVSERVPLIPAQTEKISPDGLGGWKTIVNYLVLDDFTPLILLDGCPVSKCKGLSKRATSFCLFDQREIRRKHDECLA